MEIEILIDAPEWEVLDLPALTREAFLATMAELDLEPTRFGLSLLACDDDRIAELNTEFRGRAVPTNVLSWPSEERRPSGPGETPVLPRPDPGGPPLTLGDIALAFQTCASEAAASGRPLALHCSHLIVHGLMHCLGFDHENDADAALMEGLESRILARLGVPDPY